MRRSQDNILTKLLTYLAIFFIGLNVVSAQAPNANFTSTPLSGCSPVVVNFQDVSTGNPTSWSWDFGNGNTSTLQNPIASYFTPGTYTVKLTATNSSGSNTLVRTQYISVYEAPTVDFNANILTGCYPLTVRFTDLSTGGFGNTDVSWQWDFGNGTTSTTQNPSVTYSISGTYTVTLIVTNDKGCARTISRSNYITVTNGVNAGFTNSQPASCNAPAPISFTDASTGPGTLSYFWDFGDGTTSTMQNPTHTYLINGSFTPILTVSSSSGCTDSVHGSTPIGIGSTTPDFTSPATVCVNATAVFTNTSLPAPANASWSFGDGGTSSQINAIHIYTTPGTYTVILTSSNPLCNDSVSKSIVVVPGPVANFTSPNNASCTPPLTVNFQDQSTGAVSWQWNFGDGTTSSQQNPSHTYNSYGTDTVRLVVTNAGGCTDTIVKAGFVNIQQVDVSIPNLPARGCIPLSLTLTPTIVSVDPITSYQWDFGDGTTSTSPNPTHTYGVQGSYTVRLITRTNTGCLDTVLINNAVRVGTNPTADFTASPLVVCTHQPIQFTDLSGPVVDEWLWDFGDSTTSTAKNPTHMYSDSGFFTVTLVASNSGCSATRTRTNYIHILPPVADFDYTLVSCADRLEFNFTDRSVVNPAATPLNWSWNFGDGSPLSALQNPTHRFPALGSYTVTLIVNNGTCSDTLKRTVDAIRQQPDFTASQTTFCQGTTIVFTPSNFSFALTTSLFWDAGDGTTATFYGSPPYKYPNSGTYTVSLVATDINGCKDTVTKVNYIRVNGPIADFTATNLGGCVGLVTTFNDLSTSDGTNSIQNWHWDFGDGSIQDFTGPPFQHTYNTAGTFPVTLVVTDAVGCSDTLKVNNLIHATDPLPDFVSPDTLTCPGATVTFNNTSTAANFSSQWDFGDGNTSSSNVPTNIYTTPGSYDVKLRIQDVYGCADSLTKNLYIRVDNPVASFTLDDSISSCTPLQVQFTNTSTYYSSVVWDFGPGGSATIDNPVHFFNTPGTHTAKLIITSPGGCKDSATKTITVYDTAGSVITYPPLSGCNPLPASFTTFSPGPMSSYIWDFGDGTSVVTTVPFVSHVYSSFGSFLPKVIQQDPSGCLIPVTGVDTVKVIGVTAKFGLDKNVLCDFGTVNFIDSTTFNDPVINMNWSFGDGGTSTQQNPSHDYLSTGIYDVSLMVESQNGCRDTATILNALKVVNSPVIGISGDSVICAFSSLLQSGIFLQTDTAAVSWTWNFPNGNTSSSQNPDPQIYSSAGNFVVTAIATNSSGCKDTTLQNIYVNPLPTATIPASITIQSGFPALIAATYASNVIGWNWTPTSGLSCTDCATPTAGPVSTTTYRVTYTDSNGCANRSEIEVVVVCKNSNLFIPNTFSPNGDGNNDVFYPRGVGLGRVKFLRVFNRWGEVVFERLNFQVNDAASGWNGTFKGRKPQPDVYIFQTEIFCGNGEVITLNGNISLIL